MTPEEIVSNFGGGDRLYQLGVFFQSLHEAGCELFIVSIGFKDACIIPHLNKASLEGFSVCSNSDGQETDALRKHRHVKADLIKEIMERRGWTAQDALFTDDSERHITPARKVCQVLHVSGHGLTFAEMDEILKWGQRAAAVSGSAGAALGLVGASGGSTA
eukprot:CAMPEP_0206540352 /NCGR_PEP_ID=MMETSP0325_2-20121206/8939_1 /ASSEMBLY_ACC=CAM_ASM_000347 /TAXON_ID=2866 /ORGANISM="Crypthecodinium cohnii, Strain Seligo" /LENGTH=160 /DNA_ID=CAMNT_0054038029 /DNA_START=98 /DNA_END=580 /DNA_ORIENTATION=+